jgi:signal transduction histidine kinase
MMLARMGIANLFATLPRGRPMTAAWPHSPAAGDAGAGPVGERLPELARNTALILPVAIFVVSACTIGLSHWSNFVTSLWPSNGIVVAVLLRHAANLRTYATVLAGAAVAIMLANMTGEISPALAAVLTASNLLEIVCALVLLALLRVEAANLASFGGMIVFILAAGAAAPFGSGVIGAMAIGSAHGIPWRTIWLHTYPAHALGMIMVAPFLLSATSSEWRIARIGQRFGEAAAVLAVTMAAALCAAYFRSVLFIIVPAVLLATVRFSLIGAAAANLVTALIISGFVVMDIGDPILARTELSERILALQILLGFTSLWCLPMAALLSERDRLLRDLSRANSQLRLESEAKSDLVTGLRRHLSIVEEKERLRLSYELHDQAGQDLIATILQLNEIDALTGGPVRERLHLVRRKMEALGKTLHRISWELRPPAIAELGLRKALASYIADWGEQCDTGVDFHCDDLDLDALPDDIGTALYRVIQEALTNIVKHAGQPSAVSVVIRRVNATLQVIIDDNGCGFDVGGLTAKTGRFRGLGLAGMRERLLLIGGVLEIESAAGAGTTLFARITLDAERSAA